MTVQTVPYALQNASHSAALFRQSASAPFLSGGPLGSLELLVTQQASPNMSVLLGPGRCKVVGTSVSAPASQLWTTQAMYDVLNDAALTLTIAASNPTNPRIDVVYVQVQDSFYSGATNQAIAGVVTGTPAASPSVPAVPANSTALYTIAVGAGVTTIVNANIARVATSAALIGGLFPTATATTLAALQTAATLPSPAAVAVIANGSEWYWNGTTMSLSNVPRVASAAARDALYVAPVVVAAGDTVYRTDTKMRQMYDGTRWRYTTAAAVPVIPTSAVNGTVAAGGSVTFSAVTSVSINGCFTAEFDNYEIVIETPTHVTSIDTWMRLRVGGVDASGAASYGSQRFYGNASSAFSGNLNSDKFTIDEASAGAVVKNVSRVMLYSPFALTATFGSVKNTNVVSVTNIFEGSIGIYHTAAASYDGITVYLASGTMSGTIRVYGWNNN